MYLCKQLPHPNLTVEVLLIEQQEIRCEDGKGSWRRHGVSILDRQLLSVQEVIRLSSLSDFAALLPPELDSEFTNSEIAAATGVRRRTAQAMTYSLRQMGALQVVGKRGREQLVNRSEEIGIVGATRPGSSGDRATAS